MKLQGVIILRISDFRRFFDLEEFLVKKTEFVELLKTYGASFFCDTMLERDLCSVVRNWISGSQFSAEFEGSNFVITGANGRARVPLGRLKEQVDKYSDQLGFTDLKAITALYLLAGVNLPGSPIEPDYSTLISMNTGNYDGSFITVLNDVDFPAAQGFATGPFELKVIANVSAGRKVKVTSGSQSSDLAEGEAMTAVFSGDKCVCLFKHIVSDLPHVHASLVADKPHRRANLHLNIDGNTKIIEGVTSVWIEPGAGVAYTTDDSRVVYDTDKCYQLKSRIATFEKFGANRRLLAINKTESGSYVLYTDKQIDH